MIMEGFATVQYDLQKYWPDYIDQNISFITVFINNNRAISNNQIC